MRLLLQIFVEFTPGSILKDQIDFFIIPKKAIHPQNISVSQMRLYLNFSPQLVFHIRFQQLLLVQHLQCHYELRFLLSRQVDMSKLSPSEWFSNFKVIDGPFFTFKFLLSLLLSGNIKFVLTRIFLLHLIAHHLLQLGILLLFLKFSAHCLIRERLLLLIIEVIE